ncbi:MAG: 8-hydroxy-5-deazaflavin:NADPH oxidoreductase [Nocardioidaceae bacterium]|jgi:predicted dinucleotide-binding enzyme|nr:8-hydroxy-5-deazaflavin:NADPH oxidoreductase [Nocardioidaceae bacterium]
MRIGILGSGEVGQALARGLARHDHEVVIGTRKEAVEDLPVSSPAEAVENADLVFLSVVGTAAVDVVTDVRDRLSGKVVIDTTNPLDFSSGAPGLFVGHSDSLGEQVQRAIPEAHVVKAYNTVGNALMVDPDIPGGPPTMLIGGDSDAAKGTVTDLLKSTGWDVVDLGGIEVSRYLEPMCILWVLTGFRTGSWQHAFRLLRPETT